MTEKPAIKPLAESCRSKLSRHQGIQLFILVATGILCYSNTFNVPFYFDDIPCIKNNPAIQNYFGISSNASSAPQIIQADIVNSMKTRPLAYATFALNYLAGGLDVRGYHVVNLVIHLLVSLCVFWLLTTLLQTPFMTKQLNRDPFWLKIPFIISLLFVCHPSQIQAVTYITQRFSSMASLFYIVSLTLYLRARLSSNRTKSLQLRGMAVAVAVIAMFSHEFCFTLPVMAIGCDVLLLKGKLPERIRFSIPLIATMVIIPINTVMIAIGNEGTERVIYNAITLSNLTEVSVQNYFTTQMRVLITYLRLMLLPINKHLDYDYPVYETFFALPVLFSAITLTGIIASAFYSCRKSASDSPAAMHLRFYSLGVLWFIITISMSSSFIPLDDMIMEYRLYLPSLGFFIAIAAMAMHLKMLSEKTGKNVESRLSLIIAFIVCILALATYQRNKLWDNPELFWQDNIKKASGDFRPYLNLARVYFDNGRFMKSIEVSLKAIERSQNGLMTSNIWSNIAASYALNNKNDKAVEAYEKSVGMNPENFQAHVGYAILLEKMGNHLESSRHFAMATWLKDKYTLPDKNKLP